MTKQLVEHGRLLEANVSTPGEYDVTLITEGVGSKGVYTREMLQANAGAFNRGTKSFRDHPKDPTKPWERSLDSIVGKLSEDARYVEEDGVGMLKSKLKVRKEYIDFVEEYKDVIGLSIYIGAYGEDDDETGKTLVESFDSEDPYKSVDLVVAAGRGGRFDMAMESYRKIENSLPVVEEENGSGNPAEPHNHSKESHMEIEELAKEVTDLKAVVESFIGTAAPILESLKPREDAEDEIDLEKVTEALVESGLTKRSRKAVLEAVRNGAVIEDAVSEAKKDEDDFRAELRIQEGFVEGAGSFQGEATDLGKVFG